jgi:ABC-type sugar transport system permease subunit
MKTLLPALIVLMLTSSASLAQTDSTSFSQFYEKETVYFHNGRLVFNGFKTKPHAGLYDFSPAGLAEYKKSLRSRRMFWGTYVVTVGMLAGSIASRNPRTSAVLVAGSVVTTCFYIHFSFRSINQLHKSIWLRNRDVLSRKL